MDKRLIVILFLSVFLLGVVSAVDTCQIQLGSSITDASKIVMEVSGTTNAHGGRFNTGESINPSSYYLTCPFSGIHACSNNNKIMRVSTHKNAHAEATTVVGTTYQETVCFGDLKCSAEEELGVCPVGFATVRMASLTSLTNAHIGKYDDYPIKICCEHDIPTGECEIESASWSTTTARADSTPEAVYMNYETIGVCQDKNILFSVHKNSDDKFVWSTQVFYPGEKSWEINDQTPTSEYYFKTQIEMDSTWIESTNLLTVTKCGDGIVDSGYEQCDGSVGDETCIDVGEELGEVKCTTCQYDYTGCYTIVKINSCGDYTNNGGETACNDDPEDVEWSYTDEDGCTYSNLCVWENGKCDVEYYVPDAENPLTCVPDYATCKYTETTEGSCSSGDEFETINYELSEGETRESCQGQTIDPRVIPCQSSVSIPFFDKWNLIASVLVVMFIYMILSFRKKKEEE